MPFDLLIEIAEGPAPPVSEDPADRRGADAAYTDQADPQLRLLTPTPAIRGCVRGAGDIGEGQTARIVVATPRSSHTRCLGEFHWALTHYNYNATYITYTRNMSQNAMPLPYEVQEMTTTEARKHLPELVNMAAYGHVTTVLTRDGRRLARIVPEEDAWVYSPAWQERLREADTDLAAGRVRQFEDDDDFLAHLEALDDEAGG